MWGGGGGFACWGGLIGFLGCWRDMGMLPSISSMDVRAASSYDELSDPAVMLPRPRQTHRVIVMFVRSGGITSCSRIRDRDLKQSDCFQMGTWWFRKRSRYVSRVYFESVDGFSRSRRTLVRLGTVTPDGPLMTWVQPAESVTCWRFCWGGGFLRRVMVFYLIWRVFLFQWFWRMVGMGSCAE